MGNLTEVWHSAEYAISVDDMIVRLAYELKTLTREDFGVVGTARRSDRFTFALAAARQAMNDSGLSIEPERLGFTSVGVRGIHTFVGTKK